VNSLAASAEGENCVTDCSVPGGAGKRMYSAPSAPAVTPTKRWKRPCLQTAHMTLCIESGSGGLTREVETPLPSNSPLGPMILRVEREKNSTVRPRGKRRRVDD
jgi:hypothetical protein